MIVIMNEVIMNDNVLSLIKEAEAHYLQLQEDRPVPLTFASVIFVFYHQIKTPVDFWCR